jgi:hypothetical protein
MDTLIKLIYCCFQEEINNNKNHNELEVPIGKEVIKDKKIKVKTVIDKSKINYESLNLNSTEANNNTTEIFTNTLLNNTNNNIMADNNNSNSNSNSISHEINNKLLLSSPPNKKKGIYNTAISNNYFHLNKNNLEIKKYSHSLISKNDQINKNSSHKGTILTLNDLILINQDADEKIMHEMGCKLLLSGELFFWKEIIITTNGIKNSLRKEKSDHVFFGIKNILNNSNESYNDLILNFFCQEEDITSTGRVFEIYYNKNDKEYSLRFLHPNLILYYKINNFVYFSFGKEYYFLLGNVLMSVYIQKVSTSEKIINVQIEIENNKPLKYCFTQSQAPIKIGRAKCDINIFSSSISKRHGIIEYSKINQSFYYKDMGSTNGSTLIIKLGDVIKMKGEMNYKLEDVPFRIQEIP